MCAHRTAPRTPAFIAAVFGHVYCGRTPSRRPAATAQYKEDHMDVRDIMTAEPACCDPDTGLQDVARMMLDNDCGAIPVCEDGKPVGIVSDRDIAIRAVAEGRNPIEMTASEIMSSPVETVTEDTSIDDLFDLMEDKQIRRVVVVDDEGAVCGIVAQADIAEYAGDEVAEVVQEISEPQGSSR
jgi:CBS domain-containing protein